MLAQQALNRSGNAGSKKGSRRKRASRKAHKHLPEKHTGELVSLFGGLFLLIFVILGAGYYFFFI